MGGIIILYSLGIIVLQKKIGGFCDEKEDYWLIIRINYRNLLH